MDKTGDIPWMALGLPFPGRGQFRAGKRSACQLNQPGVCTPKEPEKMEPTI